jgi:hypothetical protein
MSRAPIRRRYYLLLLLATTLMSARSQVPVELFAGHEKTTFDLQFFRYFKQSDGQNSRWLFFNRNRASIDYGMTSKTNLPQFGFTEALSYNHPVLKGFAPVAVVQVFNTGVFPKAGIQYARVRENLVVFSWLVAETLSSPDMDYFLLLRYTPLIKGSLRLFLQGETINSFPLYAGGLGSFIQRLRVGLKQHYWQWGLGGDFSQNSRNDPSFASNLGLFIRYEF